MANKKFPILERLKKIGCGCLIILLILIILGFIFSGIIIRKLISGAIQQKTGVTVNINDLNKGNLTYTDPKTGAKLTIGDNKIPDNFPADFPVYPGSTVTTSQTGNGFWLTLVTKDSVSKVSSFYQNNLKSNNWNPQITIQQTDTGAGWSVSKDNLVGTVVVETGDNQTSILIVLGLHS